MKKSRKLPDAPTGLTDIIAERRLILVEKGRRRRVSVRIGKPVRDVPTVGGMDWRCPIAITGLRKIPQAYGVDSMQALLHAMKMLEIHLVGLANAGGSVEWLGSSDIGFPKIRMPRPKAADIRRLNAALLKEGLPPIPGFPSKRRHASA